MPLQLVPQINVCPHLWLAKERLLAVQMSYDFSYHMIHERDLRVQVIAHVVPLGSVVKHPVITFTCGRGSDTRLVMNGDLASFACNSVLSLNPFTGRQKAVGFHPGWGQLESGWGTDFNGKLLAAFQGPEGGRVKSNWTIRPVNRGPVLFSYQQDWCSGMLYPTWVAPSADVICCAVRQVMDSMEIPQTFLRFRLSSGVEAPPDSSRHGLAGNPDNRAHVPTGRQSAEHWVKECEVKLPFYHMENVCPRGRIVIQITEYTEPAPRKLVHFDTDADEMWEIMPLGSKEDFPSLCTRWVPAGPSDPARFTYVAACASNYVVLVDAEQHGILCGWTAASLLRAERPRRPKQEAWREMSPAQLRKALGPGKQSKHVEFLNSSFGMFALAASGGRLTVTYF